MRRVLVEMQVGDIRKALLVHGDRRWRWGLMGRRPSRPEKFLKLPVIYERAFGGTDLRPSSPKRRAAEPRNPIGVGFRGVPSQNPAIHTQVPNVEYPHDRMRSRRSRPAPAGLGALARGWKPRLDFAGTYDEVWLNEQWPLLPVDFDQRHNQAAPTDQQSKTLRGGEYVQLINLTPEGRWQFRLPVLDIPVHLFYDDRYIQAPLRMDTVLIESDIYRVTMTSRLKVSLPRNQSVLREVVLGHMFRGWLRARATRKIYLDQMGTNGMDPTHQCFHL
jgi:hypothetical protein